MVVCGLGRGPSIHKGVIKTAFFLLQKHYENKNSIVHTDVTEYQVKEQNLLVSPL